MAVIIEPFRIKSVEPIRLLSKEERIEKLQNAFYNPFLLNADDVLIDLLTDSGTSAMSSQQWAAMMQGDESYAGSRSFHHFESVIKSITGMTYVIPTHQGRAAEKILFSVTGGTGKVFISNTFFDTTRANIEFTGAAAIDMLCAEGKQPLNPAPFKGNLDTEALINYIEHNGSENIAMVMITVTNNSGGGQPVSMSNIKMTANICNKYHIPFFIDACRFAENCYFIQQREAGYENESIRKIANELFSYADGCTMSAKKDAFANIGGFLALRTDELVTSCRNLLIITEGFPTYGGLAGRDLEAIAVGLCEVMEEDYLQYRIKSTAYLSDKLHAAGIPVMQPAGGHAVYIDAQAMLPHIPVEQYPGQALVCEMYLHAGIRAVEVGSLMFGKYDAHGKLIPSMLELVRMAIPRRVYTQSHIDYVAEAMIEIYNNRKNIRGMKIDYEAPVLRHFTAKLSPLS